MLSPTDYADLFVAAVEGGINYWAEISDYEFSFDAGPYGSDTDFASASITVFDSGNTWKLDSRSEEWHNAVAEAAKYMHQSLADFFEDHDAGSADIVTQFALFGEVIYG